MKKVRFNLRTKAEGLKPGFTKPDTKKHRVNTGGKLNVCAAIVGCKVKVWHYLPKTWNATEADKLYRGPIARALNKYVGEKGRYTILENNDPTGYKSNKAKKAKSELNIH